MTPLAWLGILAILLVIEAITVGLTTVWFAGGALVACIASWLDGNGSYTVYGYCCYYNENGSGQATDTGFLGLMSIGYNNEWLGYGDAGYAGYRCVRDIE